MSKNSVNKKDNSKIVNTFIIIGIIFLIGSLILMFNNSDANKTRIKEINYQEYTDIIKEDKYNIILLTQPTCSHCVNYKPYVNYVATEYNLDVYDIDLTKLSLEEYTSIHDKFSAIKDEVDSENNPAIPTPVTVIVRNGEEVTSTLGDLGQNGFLRLLKNNGVIEG